MVKISFLMILLVGQFSFLLQAAKPNIDFSGNWVLVDKAAISGHLYANSVPNRLVLTQTKDSIIFERQGLNQNGVSVTSMESLPFDGGSVGAYTVARRKKMSSVKWVSGGQALVETSIYMNPTDESKVDVVMSDSLFFNAVGKELVVTRRNISNIGESWCVKATYKMDHQK